MPNMSGIECAILTGSISNGPASTAVARRVRAAATSRILCSSSFERTIADGQRAAVDRPGSTAELAQHERERADVVLVPVGEDDRLDVGRPARAGREVRQHQVDAEHLGVGNISPVSTTTIRPSYSTTVMFLPISPSPPSGRTPQGLRRRSNRAQQAVALERLAHSASSSSWARDHRQPESPPIEPEHRERGLHRDRVGGHGHRLVDR